MALPHQFCARAISMSLRRTCVAPSLVLIENAKCSPEAKCVGWLFQSLHSCEVAQPPSTSATTALTTISAVHEFIGASRLLPLSSARTVNTPNPVRYRTLVLLAHSSFARESGTPREELNGWASGQASSPSQVSVRMTAVGESPYDFGLMAASPSSHLPIDEKEAPALRRRPSARV